MIPQDHLEHFSLSAELRSTIGPETRTHASSPASTGSEGGVSSTPSIRSSGSARRSKSLPTRIKEFFSMISLFNRRSPSRSPVSAIFREAELLDSSRNSSDEEFQMRKVPSPVSSAEGFTSADLLPQGKARADSSLDELLAERTTEKESLEAELTSKQKALSEDLPSQIQSKRQEISIETRKAFTIEILAPRGGDLQVIDDVDLSNDLDEMEQNTIDLLMKVNEGDILTKATNAAKEDLVVNLRDLNGEFQPHIDRAETIITEIKNVLEEREKSRSLEPSIQEEGGARLILGQELNAGFEFLTGSHELQVKEMESRSQLSQTLLADRSIMLERMGKAHNAFITNPLVKKQHQALKTARRDLRVEEYLERTTRIGLQAGRQRGLDLIRNKFEKSFPISVAQGELEEHEVTGEATRDFQPVISQAGQGTMTVSRNGTVLRRIARVAIPTALFSGFAAASFVSFHQVRGNNPSEELRGLKNKTVEFIKFTVTPEFRQFVNSLVGTAREKTQIFMANQKQILGETSEPNLDPKSARSMFRDVGNFMAQLVSEHKPGAVRVIKDVPSAAKAYALESKARHANGLPRAQDFFAGQVTALALAKLLSGKKPSVAPAVFAAPNAKAMRMLDAEFEASK